MSSSGQATASRIAFSAMNEDGGYDVSGTEHEYMLQYALDDFEFGLERVLDGLERPVEERGRGA